MLYFLCVGLGITILGLFTKKGKNAVKFVQILYETIQNNIKNPTVKPSYELINMMPVVKYGDVYLNGSNTFFHYDIICFTSNFFDEDMKEKHNYNPIHEICEKIPVNLIRTGACLASIPFRPIDFNYQKLYIAVKRISSEEYSIYSFKNEEYINLNDLIKKFEKDLIVNSQTETCLAEAYD